MSEDHFPPFSIREVEYTLYLTDEDDQPLDEVWIGGCLEELLPDERFEELRVDRHGDPYPRIVHVDESHEITIKNLWVKQRSAQRMPQMPRNTQMIFVVRWYDEESGAWCKRVYVRVTASSRRFSLESESYYQQLTFRAARFYEFAGYRSPPNLYPTQIGIVRYVSRTQSIDLYTYDFETGEFTAIDEDRLDGRAEIEVSPTSWTLSIQGVEALKAEGGELLMKDLTAVGSSLPLRSALPRVEFRSGPRRFASVTKDGELAVPNAVEQDESTSSEAFQISVNGDWVASIHRGGVAALELSELLA